MPDKNYDISISIKASIDELNRAIDRLNQVEAKVNQSGTGLANAKTSAAGLADELVRGGGSAGILSQLIGGLGFAGAVGGALGLSNAIRDTGELAVRLAESVKKTTDHLAQQVQEWINAAKAAGDYSDVISLGKNIEPQLDALAAKLATFRATELGRWQKTVDLISSQISAIPGWGSRPGQDAIATSVSATQRQIQDTLKGATAALEIAKRAEETWQQVKLEPLNQAISEYTQKLAKLQAEQAAIDPTKSIPDYKAFVEKGAEIDLTKDRLKELTAAQDKLASGSEKVGDAINSIGFDKLAPTEQLFGLNNDLAAIQDKLQEIGVAANSPNEALAQTAHLTKAEADEVIKLAGKWGEILKLILNVNAELGRADREAQQFSFLQRQAAIDADKFGGQDVSDRQHQLSVDQKIADLKGKQALSLQEGKTSEAAIVALAEQEVTNAENVKTATQGIRDSHREISALLREESDLMRNLKAQERLVSENPFTSADDKQSTLHALYLQQQQEVINKMEEVRAEANKPDALGDPNKLEEIKQRLSDLGAEYISLGFKIQTSTFGGEIRSELTQWANSFGDAGHQVSQVLTGTLNTAIQGTSQALTALIFQTGNWKQAFASAAQSIVANIIQIALQFIVSRTVMAVLNRAFGAADSSLIDKQGASAAKAWTPAAVAASTASYGAAAGFGVTAFLAAIAVGEAGAIGAASVGAAHTGGIIGFGDTPGFHSGGLTKQERLVRALVGEGFFLPHQMAAMMAIPGKEHLFKAEQLSALASGNSGSPDPGGFEVEPGILPGTQFNPYVHPATTPGGVTITFPGTGPSVPPNHMPNAPGPPAYPGNPTFIDGTGIRRGPGTSIILGPRYGQGFAPIPGETMLPGGGSPTGEKGPDGRPVYQPLGYGDSADLAAQWSSFVMAAFFSGYGFGGGGMANPNSAHPMMRFHEGGIVPIDGHFGEGVLTRDATSALGGAAAITAINRLTFPVNRPGFEAGGIIGGDDANPSRGGLSLGGDTHNFILFDPDKLFSMMSNSRAARKFVVDVLRDA